MKSTLKRILGVAVGWIGVGTLSMWVLCEGCFEEPSMAIKSLSFGIILSIVLWEGNGRLSVFLDRKISWVNEPVKRAVVGILGIVIYSALAATVVFYFFFRFGLNYSHAAFLRQLVPNLITATIIAFLISLVLYSRSFLLHWREAAINGEKLKREQLQSQFRSLKNQLNPHFLFNSLNALSSLVYKDADLSAKFIKQLSKIYRYILEYSDKEVVPLDKELACVNAYLFLQEIRFQQNLKVRVELPENSNWMVPPLTLQMLLENVIKHNVISSAEPLEVNVYAEEDAWIVVKNQLNPKASAATSTGVGLENIRARYHFLSQQETQVIKSSDSFIVKVPVLTIKNT